jgi:hypothetical protein
VKNISILIILLFSMVVVRAYAQDLPEADKIQYLIASVEVLEGAKFIRNGHEYDARTASNHLRLKLRGAGNRVKTAEDFIKLCASESSMTGEPYLMRLVNGTTVKAEVFFKNRLKEFTATADRPNPAKSP